MLLILIVRWVEFLNLLQQNHQRPKVIFQKFDIRGPVKEFLEKFGSFDHIFSFFCFNWIRNQKEALENILELLTPGGHCLLMFLTSTNAYTVYKYMSKTQKWAEYMHDVDLIVPVHHYTADPLDDYRSLCQSVGFTCSDVQMREPSYVCKDYKEYKGMPIFSLIISIPIRKVYIKSNHPIDLKQ